MGAESNVYHAAYDMTSEKYGLTWNQAVSKYGAVRVQDDPIAHQ